MATPPRSIRVSDEEWEAIKAFAASRRKTASELLLLLARREMKRAEQRAAKAS